MRITHYLKLVKPRMTSFILVSVAIGFFYGRIGTFSVTSADFIPSFVTLFWVLAGSALLAFSCFSINQVLEIELDRKMLRTHMRPLPQGKLNKAEVWIFGTLNFILGFLCLLYKANMLCALCGASIVIIYCFVYTPFKRISSLNTLIGALPGAIPPLVGTTAASGTIDMEGLVMFSILYFWQLPHFLAIAWLYRADYANGGFKMLGGIDASGDTCFRQIIYQTFLLLVVSAFPYIIGIAGVKYFLVAILAGAYFLLMGLRLSQIKTDRAAKKLFYASLIYLPAILLSLILDKTEKMIFF